MYISFDLNDLQPERPLVGSVLVHDTTMVLQN